MNNEQMKKTVANAPDGATHVDSVGRYLKNPGAQYQWEVWRDGKWRSISLTPSSPLELDYNC